MTHMFLAFSMSKGGQGAAAANILLLKKSEESRKQETVIRDAIRVMLKNKQPNINTNETKFCVEESFIFDKDL